MNIESKGQEIPPEVRMRMHDEAAAYANHTKSDDSPWKERYASFRAGEISEYLRAHSSELSAQGMPGMRWESKLSPKKPGRYYCGVKVDGEFEKHIIDWDGNSWGCIEDYDCYDDLEIIEWLDESKQSISAVESVAEREEVFRNIICRAERYLREINDSNVHDPGVGLYRDNNLIQLIADIEALPPSSPSMQQEAVPEDDQDVNESKRQMSKLIWDMITSWQDSRDIGEDLQAPKFSYADIESDLYEWLEKIEFPIPD